MKVLKKLAIIAIIEKLFSQKLIYAEGVLSFVNFEYYT